MIDEAGRGFQPGDTGISFACMTTPQRVSADSVREYLEHVVGDEVHALRILSMANATLGVIQAGSLSVSAIGCALADAEGLNAKHAIKQVDRLVGNEAVDVCELFADWVPFVIGSRKDLVVAIDWTDFDADGHSVICIYAITSHGRATPLVWSTVDKATLKGWRNIHEDTLLKRLAEVIPEGVKVVVLGDRGFGDTGLYALLDELGFGYVIRFRGNIMVEAADGTTKPAKDWVADTARPRMLKDAKVTNKRVAVAAVVCVKAKKMKEPWCLATNLPLAAAATVKTYSRRFTIEERFRDSKDPRFGFGLSATHVRSIERRDRLLLLDAFAGALLTLLGAAGEQVGLDRMLKANTVKRRTHSLLRQGWHYYRALPMMKPERCDPLIQSFGELVRSHVVFRKAFGLL